MGWDMVAGKAVVALCFDEPAIADDLAQWCGGRVERLDGPEGPQVIVWIPSTRGLRPALLGHWIVRHGPDDYTAVPPEDFLARYEPTDV